MQPLYFPLAESYGVIDSNTSGFVTFTSAAYMYLNMGTLAAAKTKNLTFDGVDTFTGIPGAIYRMTLKLDYMSSAWALNNGVEVKVVSSANAILDQIFANGLPAAGTYNYRPTFELQFICPSDGKFKVGVLTNKSTYNVGCSTYCNIKRVG